MSERLKLPHQSYRSDRGRFGTAISDIGTGACDVRLWSALAWQDFIQRYQRSYLGALWAVVSFTIFALALLFLVTMIRGETGEDGVPYVVIGFLVFQLLSGAITDGASVFINAQNWIRSIRLPYSTFVYTGIFRTFILFLFNVLGALIILVPYGFVPMNWGALWALPGVLAILLNMVWVYLFLGTVVARIRDLQHLIQTGMRMALFLTPIMWRAEGEGMRATMALYNPLTHYIAIVREPLLTGVAPVQSWLIVGGMTVGGAALTVLVFSLWRHRLAFWV